MRSGPTDNIAGRYGTDLLRDGAVRLTYCRFLWANLFWCVVDHLFAGYCGANLLQVAVAPDLLRGAVGETYCEVLCHRLIAVCGGIEK